MPTEEELLANKRLITVSNLTKYTTELKKYFDLVPDTNTENSWNYHRMFSVVFKLCI